MFELILKPVVTEKATAAEKSGKYQFYVRNDATKISIKNVFKAIYGVDAIKVNVLNGAEKTKMGKTRRPMVKRHALKKVIITTKAKKTVDISKPKFKG